MKATFPHLGTAHLALATLLADLGLEPVVPPRTGRRTIALGVKHAPEFACFPLKVNIGNYLEAFAAGAEIILMVGGVGPCRLGYYAQVEREILRGLGYDFEMIVLEPPQGHWRDFWRAVRRVVPRRSAAGIASALFFAYRKLSAIDELERLVNRVRPRELRPGETSRVWEECQAELGPCTEMAGLERALRRCRERLAAVTLAEGRNLLRIGLSGEIYMVLEPAVNFGLERLLGERGVEVDRHIYLSDWLAEQLRRSLFLDRSRSVVRALARPYLGHPVGGHGLESVAQAVEAGVNRLDGMIHLAPFTCMPEIVAQSVLPRVGRELDLPIMSLSLDEHSAEAGILTRIEAFLDLAARRRGRVVPTLGGLSVDGVFSRG